MNWLKTFLTSSVGRKYLMGVTGLFLCFFLVMHLSGNFLLFIGEETYNNYAHMLHSNEELLMIVEVVLYVALVGHILVAVGLQPWNRAARGQRYAFVQSKRDDRVLHGSLPTPDRTMLLSGIVVLLFLIVHLSDFKFEWGWSELQDGNAAAKAKVIVSDGIRGAIYIVGSLVLGIHVAHGLQSAFQSLGLNHSKYTPTIRRLSWVFGLIVGLGFGCFPVVGWLNAWGKAPAPEKTTQQPADIESPAGSLAVNEAPAGI